MMDCNDYREIHKAYLAHMGNPQRGRTTREDWTAAATNELSLVPQYEAKIQHYADQITQFQKIIKDLKDEINRIKAQASKAIGREGNQYVGEMNTTNRLRATGETNATRAKADRKKREYRPYQR